MNFRSAETSIPLSVGWLIRKMVYSSGEEEYHAASGEFRPSEVKRIVFAVVE